ncbi:MULTISPECIES: Imm6 family immunity protein [unclassified Niallia]|uniref:Imm6 family immunity protein n=1 Tax=unclassified Niallia TaxID=2837522 RepID=UPI001EDB45B3|nr:MULTISPECIES: Imm6 family immunity protein [unclassified Niallia]MCM3030927.1 Imm6 family immunity protein [Niallia sp. MER 6]UPO90531.1 Imm6 family immunity protein [Niallia sp. Man26]
MEKHIFSHLSDEEKVLFFILLSKEILSDFSQNALLKSLEWVKTKQEMGYELYNLLDDEENGITIIHEMSENGKESAAWNCIIDTVAYTSRKAMEKEGVEYFPEPIALVDDTLVEHFISSIKQVKGDSGDSTLLIKKTFEQLLSILD